MSIRRTTAALAATAVTMLVLTGCEAPRPERTVATATPSASPSPLADADVQPDAHDSPARGRLYAHR